MLLNKTINPPIAILLAVLIGWLVPSSFAKLSSFGGAPQEAGTIVHYRLKPIMRFFLFAFAAAGIAAIWSGIQDGRHGSAVHGVVWITVGIAAVVLPVMTIGHKIILDGEGIHSLFTFCCETAIAWNDLSHVERLYNTRSMTTCYYIRSSQGTTITVGDSSFNTKDLLQRIRNCHPLPERPYQRRRWYGG